MTPSHSPQIAIVGTTSWQRLMLPAGSVSEALTGAALSAMILAKWEVAVSLVSLVGEDERGRRARLALHAAGINLTWLATRPGEPTSCVTMSAEGEIDVIRGARLARGDRLDVLAIFSQDLVVLDLDDGSLLQFLVDLPAHTVPTTRLLGTLTHLAKSPDPERLRIALAHDALFGTEQEFLALTAASTLDDGIELFQNAMRISNLRTAVMMTPTGTTVITPAARIDLEAAVGMPSSSRVGAALLAGVAFGMVQRWPWEKVVPFATAAATLFSDEGRTMSEMPALAQIEEVVERLSPALPE